MSSFHLDVDSIAALEVMLCCFGQFKERIKVIIGARISPALESK